MGGISRSVAREIFGEVEDAVHRWPEFAAQYGVPKDTAAIWAQEIDVQTQQLRADAHARGRASKPPKNQTAV